MTHDEDDRPGDIIKTEQRQDAVPMLEDRPPDEN